MASHEINYIECPDEHCEVWFEQGQNIEKLCAEKCKGSPKLYIICSHGCGKKIYRELDKGKYLRVDCDCGACHFSRMSGIYERVFINKQI